METKTTKSQNTLYTLFACLLALPVIAVYLDGWHHHHLDLSPETLFSSYHLFFYVGVALCGVFVFLVSLPNLKNGYSIKKSVPHQYTPTAWGVGVFVLAAVLDLSWHKLFGFEESVDALLSPPHMLLAFGGLLSVSSLLKPLWNKQLQRQTSRLVPVLGITYFLLVFDFFIQYCHPYYTQWLSGGVPVVGGVSYIQAAALSGSMLRTLVFCGLLYFTLRKFKLPVGALLLISVAEAVGISYMGGQLQYILSGVLAGLLTELIYHTLYDHLNNPLSLRLFGFLIPAAFYVSYIFVSLTNNSTWWSVHMVAGMVVVNGVTGWLLTYLILPPYQKNKN